jgi:hypothetical protein
MREISPSEIEKSRFHKAGLAGAKDNSRRFTRNDKTKKTVIANPDLSGEAICLKRINL